MLDQTLKDLNCLSYAPVNPLLVYVMGLEAAKSRDATDAERQRMGQILREAMGARAYGWSAQRTAPGSGFDVHRDYDGSPFASDLTTNETALALASVLKDYDHSFIQTLVTRAVPTDDLPHIEDLARVSDSVIVFNAVATDSRQPTLRKDTFAWVRRCQLEGLKGVRPVLQHRRRLLPHSGKWMDVLGRFGAVAGSHPGVQRAEAAKFSSPAHRAAMEASPPIVFPP